MQSLSVFTGSAEATDLTGPIAPVRVRRMTIQDADGRSYFHCLSGAGTLAPGHNHPIITDAIRRVSDAGASPYLVDLATPVKDVEAAR